jgi:outer membrane lipoprotein-sorting protein
MREERMAKVTRTSASKASTPLRLLIAAIAAMSFAFPAHAIDPVPLPHLRPPGKGDAVGAVTAAARAPVAVQVDPNSPFTPAQQTTLANINAYFNSFSLMEGQFIQFGPSGEQSEGVFFLSRPGKIRFHYKPPSRLDVIADGSSVAIKDGKTNTQDLYPLSKTPLRYLLSKRIDLTSKAIVSAIKEEQDLIALVILEKSAFVEGKLTLIFDKKTFALRRWVVTDAQGLNTSVDIFNVTTGKAQDPNLFRISTG